MNNGITFFFNGEEFYSNTELNLQQLLEYFDYSSTLFVIEYNNFICPKNDWKKMRIQKNDVIEIITIVGGG